MAPPALREDAAFGQSMRDEQFAFDPTYTPLNHGSYGAFPNVVRDKQRELQDNLEGRSDPFIRFTIPGLLDQSRAEAATLLGASVDDGKHATLIDTDLIM